MNWHAVTGRCVMAISILAIGAVAVQRLAYGEQKGKLRPAGVAGAFYPADPAALNGMMDAMLAQVKLPKIEGQIEAVVSPHAGYPYSGPVAAYTYAALKGRKYSRVL